MSEHEPTELQQIQEARAMLAKADRALRELMEALQTTLDTCVRLMRKADDHNATMNTGH